MLHFASWLLESQSRFKPNLLNCLTTMTRFSVPHCNLLDYCTMRKSTQLITVSSTVYCYYLHFHIWQ